MSAARWRGCAPVSALLVCVVAMAGLSGCTLFHRGHNRAGGCTQRPFAGNTDGLPPLVVPSGLSAPDTRNAVKIPELKEPERVRAKNEACLAEPPSYGQVPSGLPAAAPVPKSIPAPLPALPAAPVEVPSDATPK